MALTTEQQMLVEQRLANDKKSTLVAYLLWFFVGPFGAHRYYLGKTASGLVMLALLIVGFLTVVLYIGAIFLGILGIWMIVDAFLIPGLVEQNTAAARERISRELAIMTTPA
ncbi:MAG: TM2 domain-containing protein [Exiguobacterium profundum]|nr:MAG: TM2 domain-containing protein [Exiguobacterium profundum]